MSHTRTPMKCWIAYEHDDQGWPTPAFLLVIADTPEQAKQTMARAIHTRAATASRDARQRLYAIFIEAPTELAADDPLRGLITDPFAPAFFGFP